MIISLKNFNYCTPKWISVFFMISFFFQPLKSQEIKKVKKYPFPNMVEQYYVLKSNKEIRNGPYRLTINNSIYQLGFYVNNQKAGTWQIYKSDNELEFIYNYDTKQLSKLSKEYFANSKDSMSRAPIFLGGLTYLCYCASNYIRLPEGLLESIGPGQYRTIVKFEIDTIGVPGNYTIQTSSGNDDLDYEAARCVKLASSLNFSFLPALGKGVPIKSSMIIPISFSYTEIKH